VVVLADSLRWRRRLIAALVELDDSAARLAPLEPKETPAGERQMLFQLQTEMSDLIDVVAELTTALMPRRPGRPLPPKTDLRLAQLAAEIEATQLVLVAYLAGIADASMGGHGHVESVFRLASKLAETTAALTGRAQSDDRAQRIQEAIEDMKALTL
jgi:hypothetical protein